MRYHTKGGIWKNSEDEILKAAVMKYGLNQWSRISSLLVRKSAKQCKERWEEWLNPNIKKTEWTKEEEEKLLLLSKSFPSQWKTIGQFIGRTAFQAMEHYEKLLDKIINKKDVDNNNSNIADPRKLKIGEIDPNPETKPARPDPIDMDEDEKEMLNEAKARIANRRGKKAKRKAREKQLEESRRLAALQKRRELRSAGIDVDYKKFNKKSKKKELNYNSEIPFNKEILSGYNNTDKNWNENEDLNEEDMHNDNEDANYERLKKFTNGMISLEFMENRNRDKEEEIRKKLDDKRLKKLKERALPTSIEVLNKLNDPLNIVKKIKLNLPAPKYSENDIMNLINTNKELEISNEFNLNNKNKSLIEKYNSDSIINYKTPIVESNVEKEAKIAASLRLNAPFESNVSAEEDLQNYLKYANLDIKVEDYKKNEGETINYINEDSDIFNNKKDYKSKLSNDNKINNNIKNTTELFANIPKPKNTFNIDKSIDDILKLKEEIEKANKVEIKSTNNLEYSLLQTKDNNNNECSDINYIIKKNKDIIVEDLNKNIFNNLQNENKNSLLNNKRVLMSTNDKENTSDINIHKEVINKPDIKINSNDNSYVKDDNLIQQVERLINNEILKTLKFNYFNSLNLNEKENLNEETYLNLLNNYNEHTLDLSNITNEDIIKSEELIQSTKDIYYNILAYKLNSKEIYNDDILKNKIKLCLDKREIDNKSIVYNKISNTFEYITDTNRHYLSLEDIIDSKDNLNNKLCLIKNKITILKQECNNLEDDIKNNNKDLSIKNSNLLKEKENTMNKIKEEKTKLLVYSLLLTQEEEAQNKRLIEKENFLSKLKKKVDNMQLNYKKLRNIIKKLNI